ncbi:MAG: GNAT family N-acetyltransferase [Flavobacteriales bacterium]
MSTRTILEWRVSPFGVLSGAEVYAVMKLRTDVFVVEQQCPYAELDGQDEAALHLTGSTGDGRLAAYARILPPHGDGRPHIGRVVVHPEHRGKGLGTTVMREAIRVARERSWNAPIAISAQAHLQAFYERLGFTCTSGMYVWDGIPHIDMELTATG